MNKTIFYDFHKSLGARIIEFAGYEMPVEYSGINQEHVNVREKLGIFDVSHMGEIWIKGENAREFLQYLTTNDINRLSPGKIQYSCLPNGKGGIVDDLLVYHYSDRKYLLVVNASNTEKDYNWILKNATKGVEIENASRRISQLAVQGPLATKALQKLTDVDLSAMRKFTFVTAPFAGAEEVIISETGYTGAGGFELYFHNEDGPGLWEKIMGAGKEFGIMPVGLAARDTLRLEMGYCLYGNDIDESTSPLEAGLDWIVKFSDGNDFIDRAYLEKQKAEGPERILAGFVMEERGIPRQHYQIVNNMNEKIGEVSSGTMSPVLKKGIGMAYISPAYNMEGKEIFIVIRDKKLKARVSRPPFIKNSLD